VPDRAQAAGRAIRLRPWATAGQASQPDNEKRRVTDYQCSFKKSLRLKDLVARIELFRNVNLFESSFDKLMTERINLLATKNEKLIGRSLDPG
jgi:hypothetical protein